MLAITVSLSKPVAPSVSATCALLVPRSRRASVVRYILFSFTLLIYSLFLKSLIFLFCFSQISLARFTLFSSPLLKSLSGKENDSIADFMRFKRGVRVGSGVFHTGRNSLGPFLH